METWQRGCRGTRDERAEREVRGDVI